MCFELLGNLHTNLGGGVGDLKIRPRGDNLRESANLLKGDQRGFQLEPDGATAAKR